MMTTVGWIATALASVGVAYTVASSAFVQHFLRRERSNCATAGETIAILKPLHGAEPGLRQNLESFFNQDGGEATHLIFGVHDPNDGAVGVVQALRTLYPHTAVELVVDGAIHGKNRKISNVVNLSRGADAAILVLSDSDIGVDPKYLVQVSDALSKPGVGVVTCPYYGRPEGGFWSRFAAMGVSYQFLPNVITGVVLGMAHPCMGSTIALRRETLESIGGFVAFKDVLADDYAIGAAVRRLGLASTLAPAVVSHSCSEATLRELFSHELRWARTIRGLDPLGHAGSVVTFPTPLALVGAAIFHFSPPALAVLAAALASRTWLAFRVDRAIGRRLGTWWLLPIRDMVGMFVFLASFAGRSVEWRGAKFHVTPDGDLRPV